MGSHRKRKGRTLGFRNAASLIRDKPQQLWWLVAYLVAGLVVLVAVLAVVGHLDKFGDYAFIPAIVGAGLFGARLDAMRRYARD